MSTETNAKKSDRSKQKPAKAKAEVASAPAAATKVETKNALQGRRVVVGLVVSDKMQKTIVVKVDRRVRDPLYKKYVTRSRRFKAHDEKNEAKIGDLVSLVETRPLSRDKRWALQSVLRRGGAAPDANV